jgi:hypothetical protein
VSLGVVLVEIAVARSLGLLFTVARGGWPAIVGALLLLVIAGAGALSAFRLDIPSGSAGRGAITALSSGLLALVATELYQLAVEYPAARTFSGEEPFYSGINCSMMIGAFGIIPAGVAFVLLKRGAPTEQARCGTLALVAGMCMGAAAMQLFCPSQEAAHLLVWHVMPTVAFSGFGLVLGRRLLRW